MHVYNSHHLVFAARQNRLGALYLQQIRLSISLSPSSSTSNVCKTRWYYVNTIGSTDCEMMQNMVILALLGYY